MSLLSAKDCRLKAGPGKPGPVRHRVALQSFAIVAEVGLPLKGHSEGDVLIVGHGGVGTLCGATWPVCRWRRIEEATGPKQCMRVRKCRVPDGKCLSQSKQWV